MSQHKCKNTVFSISFFFFFILGTICGTLLFRLISRSGSDWITAYCLALADSDLPSLVSLLFLLLRPILLVLVAGILPGGYRLLPALIFFRGCLMAYSASACFVTGISPAFVIVRGFVLLPLFYFFCRWVYRMQVSGSAPLWVNPQ